MLKVSVIVPIYNAENHLNDLLKNLHEQTLQEMEFVLVLDCPTDSSASIAQAWGERDTRFHIVRNTENLHIGYSRNRGLDIARGEYVAFADDDDHMLPTMYERLYLTAAQHKSDLVGSIACTEKDGQRTPMRIPNNLEDASDLRLIMLDSLISSGGHDAPISPYCNIHNNLYHRELIEKHRLRFVQTPDVTPEDLLFNIVFTWYAKRISFIHESFYFHCIRTDSTGHQNAYLNWHGRINGIQYLYDFLRNEDAYNRYRDVFYSYVHKQCLPALLGLLTYERDYAAYRKAIQEVKNTYPWCKEAMLHYHYDKSLRLRSRLARYLTAQQLAR